MVLHLNNEFSGEHLNRRACWLERSVLFGFWNNLASHIGTSLSSPVSTGLFERYTDLLRQLAPKFRILMSFPG